MIYVLDESLRAQLRAIAEKYQARAAGCHGMDHTIRVVRNALCLSASYSEADTAILEVAAWLHDIGRGVKRASGVSHADASAKLARDYLRQLGFSSVSVTVACEAIADHSYSTGRSPSSLEGRILQDADRLDALGAIGIARTFGFAENARTRLLYHPEQPFPLERPLDDDRYTIDHFFCKLLSLTDTLHTPEARAIGERRVAFMRMYLMQFAEELGTEVPLKLENVIW